MTSEPPKEFTTKFTSDLTKDTNSDSAGKSACNPTADRSDASTEDAPSDPSGDTTTKGQTSDPTVNQNETSHPEADQPRKRNRVQAAASRLLPISSGASESCSEVLHRMNQDHVSHQVCLSVCLLVCLPVCLRVNSLFLTLARSNLIG